MVKKQFPQGTRIELVSMNDPYSPVPSGMRGTVDCVDDIGTIFPTWDNGRSLGLVYGEDSFRKLTPEELRKNVWRRNRHSNRIWECRYNRKGRKHEIYFNAQKYSCYGSGDWR